MFEQTIRSLDDMHRLLIVIDDISYIIYIKFCLHVDVAYHNLCVNARLWSENSSKKKKKLAIPRSLLIYQPRVRPL